MPNTHAIILAGGAGTRLWPLSRKRRPKQLIRLFDNQSLIQSAINRLDGLFERDRLHIVTTSDLADAITTELPALSQRCIIAEPALRDTANAIGLAANLIARTDPDAIMCVFTADHLITPRDNFHRALRHGIAAAEAHADALVTFGIKPRSPHTGYGYVQLGDQVDDQVFEAAGFHEKPDADTAARYVANASHLWNSGMFAWRVGTILDALRRDLPKNQAVLASIAADWETEATTGKLKHRYESLERVSIDFGVMEKADRVLVVPMDCDWVDVGSWEAIAALHAADADNNVTIGAKSIALDAHSNVIASEDEHLVATIGVENLIIIHSPDATLICRREEAQRVRDIVERCRAEYSDRFD